jgi:Ca2+-binding RTX toxin-like protein
MGNDMARGNEGDDVLVGDFGIFVIPSVLDPPANVDQDRQLDADVKRLLVGCRRLLDQPPPSVELQSAARAYEHPYYGQRGGRAKEVPIQTGNDYLYGDAGDDVIWAMSPRC